MVIIATYHIILLQFLHNNWYTIPKHWFILRIYRMYHKIYYVSMKIIDI